MKTRPSYFSDYLIASAVILCTLVLLAVMAATLTGFRWSKAGRTLHVDFPDVAGIHQHSQVRYAGAPAGSVVSLRHLTPEERLSSANPDNAVRVTLALHEEVPPIPQDVIAVLGADTLLSEKFIGLTAGSAGGPLLADGATLQGTAQPTFDDLIRGGADVFALLNQMLPAVKAELDKLLPKLAAISDAGDQVAGDAKELFAKASALMDNLLVLTNSGKDLIEGDARRLIGSANTIAADTQVLLSTASDLIQKHERDLDKALTELPLVLVKLDSLLGRTQGLLTTNEKDINASVRDLRLVLQEMRVVAVHAKSISAALAGGRPTRLIWTKNDEPPLSDAQILQLRQQPAVTPSKTAPKVNAGKR